MAQFISRSLPSRKRKKRGPQSSRGMGGALEKCQPPVGAALSKENRHCHFTLELHALSDGAFGGLLGYLCARRAWAHHLSSGRHRLLGLRGRCCRTLCGGLAPGSGGSALRMLSILYRGSDLHLLALSPPDPRRSVFLDDRHRLFFCSRHDGHARLRVRTLPHRDQQHRPLA